MIRKSIAVAVVAILALSSWYFLMRHDSGTGESADQVVANPIIEESDSAELTDSEPEAIDMASTVNSAFKELSPETSQLISPAVGAKYFANGPPGNYLGHHVWEIDTEQLKNQLQSSWVRWEETQEMELVSLPLSPEKSVQVAISNWKKSGFGIESAFGRVQGESRRSRSSWFHVSDNGDLEAAIFTEDGGYLVAGVSDGPYFIVLHLDTENDTHTGLN